MASDPDETKKLNVVENTKNDGETLELIGELKGESSPDLKRCQTFDGNALKLPKMLPVLSSSVSKPVTKKEKGDVKKKRAKRYVDLLAEARFVPFEEDEKGKYLHFRKEMMLMGFGPNLIDEVLKTKPKSFVEALAPLLSVGRHGTVEKLLEELKQPSDDLKRAATIPPQEEKKALQVQEENKKALSSKLEGFDGNVEDLSAVLPTIQRSLSRPPEGQWQCKACTLYNKKENTQCEVCGTEKESDSVLKGDEIRCGICWDSIAPGRIRDTECKHQFCVDCWSGYLTSKIGEGQVVSLRCPEPSCNREIKEDEVKKVVNEGTFAKYKKFQKNAAIAVDKNKRWCPTRDCNTVLEKPAGWERKVTCEKCHRSYCWKCNERYHKGSCEKKAASSNAAAFAMYKLMNTVKPCPKCRSPIERSSGCNHMTCGVCRYEFCWMCGGKYDSDHFEWYNIFGCPGGQDGGLACLGDDTCCGVNCGCCSIDCGCECIGYHHINPVGIAKRSLVRIGALTGALACCPFICCGLALSACEVDLGLEYCLSLCCDDD